MKCLDMKTVHSKNEMHKNSEPFKRKIQSHKDIHTDIKKKSYNCSQKQTNKRKTRYVYRPWLFSSHAE